MVKLGLYITFLIYILSAYVLNELNPLNWHEDAKLFVAVPLFFLWFIIFTSKFKKR